MNPHDEHCDEREWQAQERALHEERLHLAQGDPRAASYRRVVRALRAPLPVGLPADFARRVARQVGAAALDLHLEQRLQQSLVLVLVLAIPVALARYGESMLAAFAAAFPALSSQDALGWTLVLAACVGLSSMLELLRGRWRTAG